MPLNYISRTYIQIVNRRRKNEKRNHFHKKREQLKYIDPPVILEIPGTFTGTDYCDFDRSLFDRMFERYNRNREIVKTGFDANGILIKENSNPTYQGILAIAHVGFTNISNPVLYLHRHALPELNRSF